MMTEQQMLDLAAQAGFEARLINTFMIRFDPVFRDYCAQDLCGCYGKNNSCPPLCGTPEEMKSRIMAHDRALVLRHEWDVADFSDRAAVKQAKYRHNRTLRVLVEVMARHGVTGQVAGGGPCDKCFPCSRAFLNPCVFPEECISCLSAYCIDVGKLCHNTGLDLGAPAGKLALFSLIAF